jgi:hypothetical protein
MTSGSARDLNPNGDGTKLSVGFAALRTAAATLRFRLRR